MYNKLVLENSGKPFEILHDGKSHSVPSGKFEAELDLGNFIFVKANQLGYKVVKTGQPEAPKVEAIQSKEEEEVVEEQPKSKKKK